MACVKRALWGWGCQILQGRNDGALGSGHDAKRDRRLLGGRHRPLARRKEVSPLTANLLHYSFDLWVARHSEAVTIGASK
jgi:hypothetical protein